jgi:hypothetical protein
MGNIHIKHTRNVVRSGLMNSIKEQENRMPKKISNVEMDHWLADYDRGKPVHEIAKDASRDVRTVSKRIAQARKEQEKRVVRRELMKEALLSHNEDISQFITGIKSGLVVPGYDLYIPDSEIRLKSGIQLSGARAIFDSKLSLIIRFNGEDDLRWRLLVEHLGDDPVMVSIPDWKKTLIAHLNTRIAFKEKVRESLELKTGLKIVNKSGDELKESGISYFTVDLFYDVVIKPALDVPDTTNLGENIIHMPDGYILHGKAGSKLAFTLRNGPAVCDGMKTALSDLYQCDEIKKVRSTYLVVTQQTNNLKEGFEELVMIGLLPGTCRVCKRISA